MKTLQSAPKAVIINKMGPKQYVIAIGDYAAAQYQPQTAKGALELAKFLAAGRNYPVKTAYCRIPGAECVAS